MSLLGASPIPSLYEEGGDTSSICTHGPMASQEKCVLGWVILLSEVRMVDHIWYKVLEQAPCSAIRCNGSNAIAALCGHLPSVHEEHSAHYRDATIIQPPLDGLLSRFYEFQPQRIEDLLTGATREASGQI